MSNLQCCYVRDKSYMKKLPPLVDENKEVSCNGCYFVFLKICNTKQRAKVRDRMFYFCSVYCYHNWLDRPGTMLI